MASAASQQQFWIGLDIGGANIKLALVPVNESDLIGDPNDHFVVSQPFALWRHSDQLASKLAEWIAPFRQVAGIAVTMTGELADCFPNRDVGVASIVNAVEQACEKLFGLNEGASTSRPLLVFYALPEHQTSINGNQPEEDDANRFWAVEFPKPNFLDSDDAKRHWLSVAAANWHALALFASRFMVQYSEVDSGSGFLIDIGSTTTDIIPIHRFAVVSAGRTDFSRLKSGELVYAGVQRTPICSLIEHFKIEGEKVPIAREFFATAEDAFLVNGRIADEQTRLDTADGRPATRFHAEQRLAKMICSDAAGQLRMGDVDAMSSAVSADEYLNQQYLQQLSQQVIDSLKYLIGSALHKVSNANPTIPARFIVSGQGEWFAQQIIDERFGDSTSTIRLADEIGMQASRGAAAYAVAKLASRYVKLGSSTYKQRAATRSIRVIKLGGSLLGWQETPARVRTWLDHQEPMFNLWVVGGGKLVSSVRQFDELFSIDQEKAHWICIDLMSINLRLVQSWFSDWPIISDLKQANWKTPASTAANVFFDFGGWINRDKPNGLPHEPDLPANWATTSDSCAAYLAATIKADELVLLKSCEIDAELNLQEMATAGIVDSHFTHFSHSIECIRIENLRA